MPWHSTSGLTAAFVCEEGNPRRKKAKKKVDEA